MKTLQETLIDIATPASYDTGTRGGDVDSEMIDLAIKLQKEAKVISDQLTAIRRIARQLFVETGESKMQGNTGVAIIGHADDSFLNKDNEPVYQAWRLNNGTVEDLLQEFEDKDLITKNKHTRCFNSSERAVPVTFKANK